MRVATIIVEIAEIIVEIIVEINKIMNKKLTNYQIKLVITNCILLRNLKMIYKK